MLKLILSLLPLMAANVTGQPQASKTAQKAPVIQGIPAGAVQIDENTYRYQEKDSAGRPGKVWLFRRNPFGVSKIEEKEADKIGLVRAPLVETPITATDLGGDSYRFRRPGPFGDKIWVKKKSELNDEERAAADKAKPAAASTQKAAN